MKKNNLALTISFILICTLFQCKSNDSGEAQPQHTNVILIFADDLGYKDVGFMGCEDTPTPNIDALANNGVRFSNAYVTCPVCSPSRAGLMTGRYQNRFGFEDNPGPFRQSKEVVPGIPRSEKNMAEYFKEQGYATGIIGKWHEENVDLRNPSNRGFDTFFGFINGACTYYIGNNEKGRLVRGTTPVEKEDEYLTDAFGREAVKFIEQNKDNKFFLYVPFNAPHGPFQAPDKYLSEFDHIADEKRKVLAAMNYALDVNIGKIMNKLNEHQLEENTIIFFLSDNGGVLDLADNTPLRSGKQDIYEGGIRVPFCVQWKGHLPENTVYNQAVISLDILPTAIAASVGDITYSNPLDGVNLLPFVLGEEQSVPHDALYWRFLWHSAIRDGDWKLLKHRDHPEVELYNLANDIGETYDLSKELPEVVMRLQAKYEQWNSTLMDPQWSWQPDYGGSYKVEKK
jgi:arylsulfatase A-like enzyme